MNAATPHPKAPVLGWRSLGWRESQPPAGVLGLAQQRFTPSGRAAIYQALQAMALPPGSTVLLPSYHCPSMVAPVLHAGLRVRYYGIDASGLPLLETMLAAAPEARAILVAHFLGVPRSLAQVRAWCDAHGVALIEDCAHGLFGQAGERPMGRWGDFATASLSKFLPLPEGGLLASSQRPLPALGLRRRSLKEELKGVVDLLETSVQHGRLPGLNALQAPLLRWKNRHRAAAVPAKTVGATPSADALMAECHPERFAAAPLWLCRSLQRLLPLGRAMQLRRAHFERYQLGTMHMPGMRALLDAGSSRSLAAPYVFPLWVDEADRVYAALRAAGAPVLRWDQLWPDTPMDLPGDQAPLWRTHVLQLLCHQDLTPSQIEQVLNTLRRAVSPGHPA